MSETNTGKGEPRMTPWGWMWRESGDDTYGAECASREAVIADALSWLKPGDRFDIIEARMSNAKRYEGSDYIPFLRTRNAASFLIGPDGSAVPQTDPADPAFP